MPSLRLSRQLLLGIGLCLIGSVVVTRATCAESFLIESRITPKGFESEAQFLELLKNPHPSQREFRAEDAPAWDVPSLAAYVSEEGIDFTDANGPTHSHASKDAILSSLRARKGPVFRVFSHLSSIYSIPYRQYSELRFASATPESSVVDVSTWYRLSFKRTPSGPMLVRIDYLVIEDK
jgi:hypothetical protein